VNRLFLLVSLVAWPAAAAPRACLGSLPLGAFRLSVEPAKSGPPLPVRTVNSIRAGEKLKYEPVRFPSDTKEKAQVAVVLVPAGDKGSGELTIFEPVKAATANQWTVPVDTSVVALIFGPQGLSTKKLKALVDKNREVLSELADYAEQNSKVEGLIDALDESERSGRGLDAALLGFSAKYGVAMPKLDTKANTDQQAAVLLQALLPAVNNYDPLSSKQAVMQQSAGLAASVAGMFFGSPVGLAAGGASLFQNLRTLMFPGMEFRSAFAQNAPDGLALCTKKPDASKSRTRTGYLWAYRVPNLERPTVSLAGAIHAPLTSKSLIRVDVKDGGKLKNLERAREWELAPVRTGKPVAVPVAVQAGNPVLELDLTKVKAAPGEYTLSARWDWDTVEVPGKIWLHPFGNLKEAKLTAPSRGRLAEGNGPVAVTLEGPDFEFVERVSLEKADKRQGTPVELPFTLPKGKRGGEQKTLDTEIDTKAWPRGGYRLLLAQGDGLTYEVPVEVLPPYPKISNLPLRANTGEKEQRLALKGSGLDRLEGLTTEAGQLELAPANGPAERIATIRLAATAKQGELFALGMKIQGVVDVVPVPKALQVEGPRPRITSVRKSLAQDDGVALKAEEAPAGAPVSFALSVEHLEGTPAVEISCAGDESLRQKTRLTPGDRVNGVKLDVAGEGMLFLSLDPGIVGQPGCRLTATVTSEPAGTSDPHVLGQVVRVPRIQQFVLTDEKLGDGVYAGILKGQDLETIEKTGWDGQKGLPVQAIPTPAPGEPGKQVLKVALPWPAPMPHAPVFVWLRGETQGRSTGAKY
jgi:hypothetical protein